MHTEKMTIEFTEVSPRVIRGVLTRHYTDGQSRVTSVVEQEQQKPLIKQEDRAAVYSFLTECLFTGEM